MDFACKLQVTCPLQFKLSKMGRKNSFTVSSLRFTEELLLRLIPALVKDPDVSHSRSQVEFSALFVLNAF